MKKRKSISFVSYANLKRYHIDNLYGYLNKYKIFDKNGLNKEKAEEFLQKLISENPEIIDSTPLKNKKVIILFYTPERQAIKDLLNLAKEKHLIKQYKFLYFLIEKFLNTKFEANKT